MFDIGMPEFVLIAIVALLVLGPERLPEVMGKVGRAYRQLRQMSSELTGEFQRQFEEGMREVEEVSSTIRETWQGATSDGDAPAGPPPRLLQLPPPLLAPETAAGAGPWALAAPQRDTPAEPEPRAAVYPEAPFVLPRRAPAPELDFDDLAAGGPALMGPAPTDAEVAAIGEAAAAGAPEASARPGDQAPAGANGRYGSAAAVPEPAAGSGPASGNGAVRGTMSARELTVIELYRSGDLPLEKAAGFLGVTPAAFAELAEQASRQ